MTFVGYSEKFSIYPCSKHKSEEDMSGIKIKIINIKGKLGKVK